MTDPADLDRVALFRSDLLAGPAALFRLLAASEALDWPLGVLPAAAGRRLRFSGLGSSRYAALVAAAELASVGVRVTVELASAPSPDDAGEVLFAVSSSGRTPEVVALAERHVAAGGTAVAVTNAVGSPLAAASSVTLPLLAGTERSGIACTTFRATVLALLLATGACDRDAARRLVAGLAAELDQEGPSASLIAAATKRIDGAEAIDVIGDGQAIGALEQAALMLREGPRLRAAAWDAGDWLHTAVYTALPGHRAILFGGTPYDAEITDTVRRRGGEVVVLEANGDSGPLATAIVGLAAVERIAADAWSRARSESAPTGD